MYPKYIQWADSHIQTIFFSLLVRHIPKCLFFTISITTITSFLDSARKMVSLLLPSHSSVQPEERVSDQTPYLGLQRPTGATAPTSLTHPTLHSLFLIPLQRHWPCSYSFDIQSPVPLLKFLRMVPHAWKFGTQAGPSFLFRYQFKCSAFLESLS